MPVGIRKTADTTLARQVAEFVVLHRNIFDLACSDHSRSARHERFSVAPYKRGYLSSMFLIGRGADEFLLAVKHHDHGGARTERAMQVLRARSGRFAPKPLFADVSGAVIDDPVIVTEFVSSIAPAIEPCDPSQLAALIADIHNDEQLRALKIDHAGPLTYSLVREFEDESSVIDSFRPSPLRDALQAMRASLEPFAKAWAPLFDDAEVVYCHGDLPHHHVYRTARGLVVVHWEFSRRSHPSREFGRTACLEDLSPAGFALLLREYRKLVAFRVSSETVRVQEVLERFYGCIHTVFWMDRAIDLVAASHTKMTLARFELTLAYLRICAERLPSRTRTFGRRQHEDVDR